MAEAIVIALVLSVGAYFRMADLEYSQFRPDDVGLWEMARDLVARPRILTQGMPSSMGIPEGPFQVYLVAPGELIAGPLGAVYAVGLLNVIGLVLFWAFVRSYWGPRVAFAATLSYAIGSWGVMLSRRLWGIDMVAPFVILLVWSLVDLSHRGRARDSILPFVWLAIVVQVYVVALVDLLVMAVGLALGRRNLRLRSMLIGLLVFAVLTWPYFVEVVIPRMGRITATLNSSEAVAKVDFVSLGYLFHIASVEGYQAFANHVGAIIDATQGLVLWTGSALELLMAIGLGVATVTSLRLRTVHGRTEVVALCLALVAVLLPALLLVRHSVPVYALYLVSGFPLHYLFVALGARWLWQRCRQANDFLPNGARALGLIALTFALGAVVTVQLILAQAFFTAIRDYEPLGDYGLPLRHALDLVNKVSATARDQGSSRIYLAASHERDNVLFRLLRPDLPNVLLFDAASTFLLPDERAERVLYVRSSADDRASNALQNLPAGGNLDFFIIPGDKVRYMFRAGPAEAFTNLFPAAGNVPVRVVFGRRARLDGYSADARLFPSRPHELAVRWTLLDSGSPLPQFNAYLRLLDQKGRAWAGDDFHLYDEAQFIGGQKLISWRSTLMPSDLPPGAYSYVLGLYQFSKGAYREVPATDPAGAVLDHGVRIGTFVRKPDVVRMPSRPQPVDVVGKVLLEGYDIQTSSQANGSLVDVTLFWKSLERLDRDYAVFVHLLGPDGRLVGQHDGEPAWGNYPTSTWVGGDRVEDNHRISLSLPVADLIGGRYALSVGLYYLPTGERLGGPTFAATLPLTKN